MPADSSQEPTLFTVGHSNHSQDVFLDLLKKHRIGVLADVRSSPYSRYASQFNREQLAAAATAAGLEYAFMGGELGGRPDADSFYDDDGHVLYDRLAESPTFLQGIARLEKGISRHRVAIMCSEENPAVCHRHLLVARVMSVRGAQVLHIRGDGNLQSDAEVRAADQPEFVQGSLFGAEQESWRSLRPIRTRNQEDASQED